MYIISSGTVESPNLERTSKVKETTTLFCASYLYEIVPQWFIGWDQEQAKLGM